MNKHVIILLWATLAISACTSMPDNGAQVISDEDKAITITAYQEGCADTKTSVIDGGTQVYWEPGDEIKVFSSAQASKFVSQNNVSTVSASFTGSLPVTLGASISFWGLYPYREDAVSDGNSVTTALPHLQTGRAGSFAQETNIALAKSSGFDMAFYNVTAGVRFRLTQPGITAVTFEGNGKELIAGKFKVAFIVGVPAVQEIIEGQSSIILSAPDGGTFETGKWYYIVTLPQTLANGFKVTFNRAGSTAERSTSNSVTISRGTFLSIDSIDEGVEFQESITSVDLGLSVKWADRNVGASSPEECGDYYAWGETEPKDDYTWTTYKYCNGSSATLTKYCNDSSYGYNGFTDNKTVLELTDDVANVKLGGSWRMPTDAEWTELLEQCTWTWTTQNGVNGYRVTSKTNGNSIFLPIAGHRSGNSLVNARNYGLYASSSLCTDIAPYLYWRLDFGRDDIESIHRDYTERYVGLSVRPVTK